MALALIIYVNTKITILNNANHKKTILLKKVK